MNIAKKILGLRMKIINWNLL